MLLHQSGRRHCAPIGRPVDQSDGWLAPQNSRQVINLGTEEQWPLSAGRLLQYTCIFVLHPVNALSVGTPCLVLTPLWRYCMTAMVSKMYIRIYLTNRPRRVFFSCWMSCHWVTSLGVSNLQIFLRRTECDISSRDFSVSRLFSFFLREIQNQSRQIWSRKKVSISVSKNLVSKKVSVSVSKIFGIKKKFQYRSRWQYHGIRSAHLLQSIMPTVLTKTMIMRDDNGNIIVIGVMAIH